METQELLRYLVDKKEIIRNLTVFPRDISLELTKNFITSIVGPRRSGKTYFLYDLINKLKLSDDSFIFMDFDDAELASANFKDIIKAINVHQEHYGKESEYIFLDEVQNVENWHKAVRSLFETKKYFIFLSGSSSKLLAKEIATTLRGRAIPYYIFPLSFREYLNFKKFEIKKFYSTSEENKVKNYLREYLKYGGFPNIVIEKKIADKFFNEYLDLVVFKDIVERHKIKNVFVIKFLIKTIVSSFAKEFSVHKVFQSLKSQNIKVSKKTLYEYLTYLEDALFLFPLKKFSYSVRESELSIPKVFINDVGLVNSIVSDFPRNIGRIMENVVFLELKRLQNIKPINLYFLKTQNGEIDFVLSEGQKIKQLIQVCYDIHDIDVKKRELQPLVKGSKELKCKDLLVITYDYEAEEKFEGRKIKFLPLWRWLIEVSYRGK
ncbi:MAG: ATP-binding protein [Candidatus Aenigmatarchaeota archaeon]